MSVRVWWLPAVWIAAVCLTVGEASPADAAQARGLAARLQAALVHADPSGLRVLFDTDGLPADYESIFLQRLNGVSDRDLIRVKASFVNGRAVVIAAGLDGQDPDACLLWSTRVRHGRRVLYPAYTGIRCGRPAGDPVLLTTPTRVG
ncbi:hypothetical protein AB0M43_36075 [Longispora sp. NPDC051575]|uniref:hypothetical protein n=1 Tax=Longispora sp. NPDC051575 TaxID=3154943 RepID=UPI0034444CB0